MVEMAEVNASGALLTRVQLPNADLRRVDLRRADLRWTNLRSEAATSFDLALPAAHIDGAGRRFGRARMTSATRRRGSEIVEYGSAR